MSENESPQVNENTPLPEVRAAYDRAVAREKELSDQVSALSSTQRENAMLRAGVDLDSPLGTLFMNGYKGELDAEAIKTAWSSLPTAAAPPPPPAEEGPTAEELARQQRHEALNNGSVAPGSEPPPDPVEAAYKTFHDGMRRGMTRERAAAPAIDVMLKAAMDGDERMLYDATRWRENR